MKTNQNLIRIYLLSAMVLFLSPAPGQAQYAYRTNADGSIYSYTTNADGSANIATYTGPPWAVIIPTNINGLLVTSIGQAAFYRCTNLTSVTIPGSVTTISTNGFYDCTSLTNMTIPGSVRKIGQFAFFGCGLTTANIPSGLTNIGDGAFSGCLSLISITVDTNNAFYSSTNGVLFNQSQTTLLEYPAGLGGSYQIPFSVTNIADRAFLECFGLTNLSIPGSVTCLGEYAFSGCSNLTRATIPDSVTNIGQGAFMDGTSLSSVTIGDGVTCIAEAEFVDCCLLTSVTIPSGVTNIGEIAFYDCADLSSVYFKGNVPTVGSGAFAGSFPYSPNDPATIFYLPETSGWGSTFAGLPTQPQYVDTTNAGVITITVYSWPGGAANIPASINGLPVTAIGNYAFDNDQLLTTVTIPGSVTSIGEFAFNDCLGLISITVATNSAFYSSVNGVLFNQSQTTLVEYPAGLGGSYQIPFSVTNIADRAFSDCFGLTNLSIPGSVTSIGEYAFGLCVGLTNVTIPSSVNNIGQGAFDDCSSLTCVTISDGVASIGVCEFENCENLTSLAIPGSVSTIGDAAFYGCIRLRNLYFEGNAPTAVFGGFYGDYPLLNDAGTVYYLPGTTGWASSFGGVAALEWNPAIQTADGSFGVRNSQFGFKITGAANIPIVVEACTNLASPVWVPLTTNTLTGNGYFYFSDQQWTNYPARFYGLGFP